MFAAVSLNLLACSGPRPEHSEDTATSEGASITSSSRSTGSDSGAANSTSTATANDGTAGASTSGTGAGSSEDSGTTSSAADSNLRPCDGKYWDCGNGIDDDGDGKVDLEDPECTGPCDASETYFFETFQDYYDCKRDCFFDANSGSGDDLCEWNIACDPANPGGPWKSCPYTGGTHCAEEVTQPQSCVDFCGQFTLPGCDCFGCCRIETETGTRDIFLESGGCSLANLDACSSCTYQVEQCGNVCDAQNCELCFVQTPDSLPEHCNGEHVCDAGERCTENVDCGPDGYCLNRCCYPMPT